AGGARRMGRRRHAGRRDQLSRQARRSGGGRPQAATRRRPPPPPFSAKGIDPMHEATSLDERRRPAVTASPLDSSAEGAAAAALPSRAAGSSLLSPLRWAAACGILAWSWQGAEMRPGDLWTFG